MKFNQQASVYREHATIQQAVAAWCADWIEPNVQGLRALELGAGTGLFTEHLVGRGFASVVATDLAPQMVRQGKGRVPSAEWQIANAWHPGSQKFDRLYACSLLQWASDPDQVLRNWRACLTPGGKLLVALFVQGSLHEFISGDPNFAPFPFRTTEQWIGHFSAAGFQVARHATIKHVLPYVSAIAALRSLHQIGAVTDRQTPTGKLRSFLNQQDNAFRQDNCFPLTWVACKAELTISSETLS